MKTRSGSTKFVAMAIGLGLAVIVSVWVARPARAHIIVGGKTGLFTLTQGEVARIHVANTEEEHVIITVGGKVADSDGNTLAELPRRALALGQSVTFEFVPPDSQRIAILVELMVEPVHAEAREPIAFLHSRCSTRLQARPVLVRTSSS